MLQSIDIATFFNPSNEFLQFECFEIHVCRISPYNIINLDFSMLPKLLLFQESNIAFYYTTRVLSFQAIKSYCTNWLIEPYTHHKVIIHLIFFTVNQR